MASDFANNVTHYMGPNNTNPVTPSELGNPSEPGGFRRLKCGQARVFTPSPTCRAEIVYDCLPWPWTGKTKYGEEPQEQ